MSDNNEKSKQETATIKKEPSTDNKPPSYGTRLVQNKEDIKAIMVPQVRQKSREIAAPWVGNEAPILLHQGGIANMEIGLLGWRKAESHLHYSESLNGNCKDKEVILRSERQSV